MDLINNLPIEILIKVFEGCKRKRDLMLVCKKWRDIIEENLTFGTNHVIYAADWVKLVPAWKLEIAANSKRRFKRLYVEKILTQEEVAVICTIIRNNEKFLENCHINSFNAKSSMIWEILNTLRDFRGTLVLKVPNLTIDVPRPKVNLNQLTHLQLVCEKPFLDTLATPNVQKMSLILTNSGLSVHAMKNVEELWKFINENCQNVTTLSVYRLDGISFDISPNEIKIDRLDNPRCIRYFHTFCEDRYRDLQTFSVNLLKPRSIGKNYLNAVLRKAINLTEFELMYCNFDLTSLTVSKSSVRKVAITIEDDIDTQLIQLKRIFPNIEDLCIHFGEIYRDNTESVRQMAFATWRNLKNLELGIMEDKSRYNYTVY